VRVLRISRVVADLRRAETFYRERLGFAAIGGGAVDPVLARLIGFPGGHAARAALRLGAEEIELVECGRLGPPYPPDSQSNDLWFQHIAIVVGDMAAAYRSVSAGALSPISADGPQTLPVRNGGVTAFKFRDPDRHPLELIQFPQGQGRGVWHGAARGGHAFLGVDHSALAVAATARSRRFYERLGFRVADRSLNEGAPQSRLDGLRDARVRVTSLRPMAPCAWRSEEAAGMGLELLAYDPPGRRTPRLPANARMTDWTTIVAPGLRQGSRLADGTLARVVHDPDGHVVVIVDRG
jgi:catechol 2,3-dioxygenase-like lactoylglutathione lyase family enzyme